MNDHIVLFGGTFDPVHIGHTAVAAYAAAQLRADRVVFIPARRSPHKHLQPIASGEDRMEMLRLATAGCEMFEVSDCELRREEPSYTLDTVLFFRNRFGRTPRLYWLIGADMIIDLPRWHRVGDLLEECTVCVMRRGGYAEPSFENVRSLGQERLEYLASNVIETPSLDINSSEIRRRLGSGQSVTGLLCPAVVDYIEKMGLYR